VLGRAWLKVGSLGLTLVVACRLNYDQLPFDVGPGGTFGAAASAAAAGDAAQGAGGFGASSGAGASAGTPGAGTSGGGTPQGGDAAQAGASSTAGGAGDAGAASGACVPTNAGVEACDALDNDCNDVADDGDPCAPGCFAGEQAGTGYMFCGGLVTLAEAAATCAQTGMTLIRIDDAAENEWVRATAFADPVVAASPFFVLGGSDAALADDWRWPDGEAFWSGDRNGSAVGGLYTNWADGEPNDMGGGAGEACMGMGPDGTWSDIRCSGSGSEMPFGCERP
jgi:hypothetical protein